MTTYICISCHSPMSQIIYATMPPVVEYICNKSDCGRRVSQQEINDRIYI